MTLAEAFEKENRLDEERRVWFEKHKEECPKQFHFRCKCPPDTTQIKRIDWPDWKSVYKDDDTGKFFWFSNCVLTMPREVYQKAKEEGWLGEEDLLATDYVVEEFYF